MEKTKANSIFITYKNCIPTRYYANFKKNLLEAEDDVYDTLSMVKTQNPNLILILSIFLGGLAIDRFVLGDVGIGICKLIFGFFTFGLWWLIDIFLSYRKAKENNYACFMACLM